MTDLAAHPAMLLDEIRVLLQENRQLRIELDTLRADTEAKNAEGPPSRPRIEPYTVAEFAAAIRRHSEYVSDRCRSGIIRALPGKPYRIPVSELAKWTEGKK